MQPAVTAFEALPLLPALAPLSESMVHQAFLTQEGKQAQAGLSTLLTQEASSTISLPWKRLYQRFRPASQEAYTLTQQALHDGAYSTRWMITELSKRYPAKGKPISSETISRWRSTGLLRYHKDDYPEPDRAIAMLILRSLTVEKLHAWTPKTPVQGSFWEEALWTCWRQDTPTSPVLPCPVPLPADLPAHALLWTSYQGASLNAPLWLRIGHLGCCRWARVKDVQGTRIWEMSEQDLQMWGIDTTMYRNELASDMSLTLHMLANLGLLRLATERLQAAQTAQEVLLAA